MLDFSEVMQQESPNGPPMSDPMPMGTKAIPCTYLLTLGR